jgi:hypothetical protein
MTRNLPDFESEEFKSQKAPRPPVAQIINPRYEKGKSLPWGFAVTGSSAEDAGFTPPSGWKTHNYLFKSAKTPEKVHFCTEPKLLIIYRTPVYLKLRSTGEMIGEMRDHQKDFYANKNNYKVCSYAWGYVLDENNERANTNPFRISLTGASGASFNACWVQESTIGENARPRSGSCVDIEKLYHAARNQTYRPMGELFHAHCIYRPIFEIAERGSGSETAEVSVVEKYHPPILESLITDPEFSTMIKITYESVKDWRPVNKAGVSQVSADEDDGYSGRPNDRVYQDDNDLQPQYPVAPVAVKPVVSSATFSKNEEMERSQLLEDTSELISSLGWSNESGQDYLFRNFGKRGRSLLTTEELRRFKKMLEGESATQFGYPA